MVERWRSGKIQEFEDSLFACISHCLPMHKSLWENNFSQKDVYMQSAYVCVRQLQPARHKAANFNYERIICGLKPPLAADFTANCQISLDLSALRPLKILTVKFIYPMTECNHNSSLFKFQNCEAVLLHIWVALLDSLPLSLHIWAKVWLSDTKCEGSWHITYPGNLFRFVPFSFEEIFHCPILKKWCELVASPSPFSPLIFPLPILSSSPTPHTSVIWVLINGFW